MQQPDHKSNTAERTRLILKTIGVYLWGTAGGLFLYPFISFQALLAVALLITGTSLIIASIARADHIP